jgi:formate hydrogenlyase subunit 3/multisubunit Na+/H+ antiporter MnhD subunit
MDLPFALCLVSLLIGAAALIAPVAGRSWASVALYGLCLGVSSLLLVIGLWSLVAMGGGAEAPLLWLPLGIPGQGVHFRLDGLSAFFLIVINLAASAASLFAIGSGRHEHAPHRVLPFYPVFLAGMNLVVLANDVYGFLFSWEVMSVASWFLVIAHHRQPENRRAGYVYLIMAALSTQMLLVTFGLLSGFGAHLDFDAIRATPPSLDIARLALLAVVIGTGAKAGLVPLHVWLPLAHPAAPSHVSGLMSGIMTKVAIYGLVRVTFDLLGPPEWTWGAGILLLGGTTAVTGVLYALMQHDLKRLLAYHTVENIGIIAIGLGLALAFRANGFQMGAALALTAALFHVLNHSLFKTLLFLSAGAVLTATGERDLDRLGGLIRGMPITAFCFLVGSAAISALPPLNGFVSEWLALQAILISPELPQWILKFLVPMVGAGLALSAALAAACFVKAFGAAFLGRARTAAAERAVEVERSSLAAMLILVAACVLAGVLPGLVVDALAPVTTLLVGSHLPNQITQPWLTLVATTPERSSYNGLILMVFIALSASLSAFGVHRLASRRRRRAGAWDCGYPETSPATQYTAASFAQPIRRVFASVLFSAREKIDMPAPGDSRAARLTLTIRDPVWALLYRPVAVAVTTAAEIISSALSLSIRQHLGLVYGTLILLLVVLALWQ